MNKGLYNELYRKYIWYLIITVPMGMILGMAMMSIIAIINDAVSNGLDNIDYGLGAFFSVILLLFVVGIITDMITVHLATSVNYDIQMKMVKRVMLTSYDQLERVGFPKVVATLTEDMETAVSFFHQLPQLIVNSALVICGLLYMAYLSTELLVIVLAIVVLGGVTIGILLWLTKKDRVAIRESADKLITLYQRIVYGAKELSLHTPRSMFVKTKIDKVAQGIRRKAVRIFTLLVIADQWGQLLLFSMLGIIVYVVSDYMVLTTEVVIGYVLTVLFLLEPIEAVINGLDEVLDARVAFDKIDSLKLAPEISWGELDRDEYKPVKMTNASFSLSLNEIEYTYRDEEKLENDKSFVLGPVSTFFNSGEATFIVGGNGSGKSTLIKIIAGLYQADKGDIALNGKYISNDDYENYRNNFSVVSPDFCLFEDVLDRHGDLCSDLKIHSMLNKLRLSSVVTSKNSRLSNLDLSQGQRKRLALLQAYLENKQIILLDEWAADQDPVFKKIYYNEIIPALKNQGKIVIVISHDDQYYNVAADRLLKISEGKLEEIKLHKR
ncbi:MAG: cyclic peptide export ABC transporter [Pseudomonadota bacterium]